MAEEILDLDELLRARRCAPETKPLAPRMMGYKEAEIRAIVEEVVRRVLEERLSVIEGKLDKILKLLEGGTA